MKNLLSLSLSLLIIALLTACEPAGSGGTTIVNPPGEKKVENNTTVVNPPATETKKETTTTVAPGGSVTTEKKTETK